MAPPDVSAIVLAAGRGDRFGGYKQFARIGTTRLVDLAVQCMNEVASTVVVVVPGEVEWDGDGVSATGGATRSASVRNGLAQISTTAEIVVVHDASHPLASPQLAARLIAAVRDDADGAVPVLATRETIAQTDAGVLGPAIPRAELVQVQMPHAFCALALREAHATHTDDSDDATLLQRLGHRIVTVEGDPANLHVTTPAELEVVAQIARARGRVP